MDGPVAGWFHQLPGFFKFILISFRISYMCTMYFDLIHTRLWLPPSPKLAHNTHVPLPTSRLFLTHQVQLIELINNVRFLVQSIGLLIETVNIQLLLIPDIMLISWCLVFFLFSHLSIILTWAIFPGTAKVDSFFPLVRKILYILLSWLSGHSVSLAYFYHGNFLGFLQLWETTLLNIYVSVTFLFL